nr:GNAT family protein [uncultured Moellerella sp.]
MKAMNKSIILDGQNVRLEPLSHQYETDLAALIKEGKLDQLWYALVPAAENIAADIDRRLALQAEGKMLPFVVFNKMTNRVVGVTCYNNIDSVVRRVEIGATWYGLEAQRTHINTESKYLLLKYAFEQLECVAIELRTHILNHQSRKAIERLGAKFDGILRNHMYTRTGELRDTCIYSIIINEWPMIKRHLEWQMQKPR